MKKKNFYFDFLKIFFKQSGPIIHVKRNILIYLIWSGTIFLKISKFCDRLCFLFKGRVHEKKKILLKIFFKQSGPIIHVKKNILIYFIWSGTIFFKKPKFCNRLCFFSEGRVHEKKNFF